MNSPLITYNLPLRLAVYLLFIAHLGVTMVPYFNHLMDCDKELMELAESEDAETEKEDNQDEKDKRLQNDLRFRDSSISDLANCNILTGTIENLHHQEITTPPPEQFIFIGLN